MSVKRNVGLKDLTSIRIGGKAKRLLVVNSRKEACLIVRKIGFSFYILGNGSNILVKDCLIERPVITLGRRFNYLVQKGEYLDVGASTSLSFLVKYCIRNNLSGLENLSGVPAQIGGLVAMNASAFGTNVSDLIQSVEVVNKNGEIEHLKKKQIQFSYRFSSLENYIVLSVRLGLKNSTNIKEKVRKILKKRFVSQECYLPSCGSIFKNPQGDKAGLLIDSCGLKGAEKGGAQVSVKHANFIVNKCSACYSDVEYLIRRIKDRVYSKYSVFLKEEVKRWV